MNRILALGLSSLLLVGCHRIVVEIPEAILAGQPAGRPAGPRVGLAHVRDARSDRERLGSVGFERYDVRPVPADLFTQAIRTVLEEHGCLVAELADPEGMDEKALHAFLEKHHLRSVIRPTIEDFSIAGWDTTFSRSRLTSKLAVRVYRTDGEPVEQTIWHIEKRWVGRYIFWGEDGQVEALTREAVLETVRKVVEAPALREAIGLEGGRGGEGEGK